MTGQKRGPEEPMILFDLDGPLLDVSFRYFQVYREVSRKLGLPVITKKDYWKAKRVGLSNVQLIKEYVPQCSQDQLQEFPKLWLSRIEEPHYLELDRVQKGARDIIRQLAEHHDLYLVTLRRNRQTLLQQLTEIGLYDPFLKIISGSTCSDGENPKVSLLQKVLHPSPKDWILGDSEIDIQAGKAFHIHTCAVLNGIRDRERLSAYAPTVIIAEIGQFPTILKTHSTEK
jgi:phosphoglycolate phosphatase-like HAD superfamily hydrolase